MKFVVLLVLVACAHAQQHVVTPSDSAIGRPRPRPYMPQAPPSPPSQEPTGYEDDEAPEDAVFSADDAVQAAQDAERKVLLPMLSSITKGVLKGNGANFFMNTIGPIVEGAADTLHNYAMSKINSGTRVTRLQIIALEASKFIREMVDFLKKRGNMISNVLKYLLKFASRAVNIVTNVTKAVIQP